MCFNAAVSNLDDHPRNHAVLAKARQWRLSPAYDLTPSPVVARERRDLAMAYGRFGRYANKTNLLSLPVVRRPCAPRGDEPRVILCTGLF